MAFDGLAQFARRSRRVRKRDYAGFAFRRDGRPVEEKLVVIVALQRKCERRQVELWNREFAAGEKPGQESHAPGIKPQTLPAG